ncbi:MAG: cytochrome c oxidase subunit II [Candidatus Methylomirabilis sp.]|nr:cytochrome c oxidase subunit II [Deltaproteobacteria bacterium]
MTFDATFLGLAGFLAEVGTIGTDGFWFPKQASNLAATVDWLWYFIYYISVAGVLLVLALTAFFVWKYRAREGHVERKTSTHNTALELGWTLPLIPPMIVMFYVGLTGYVDLRTPPRGAYDINVTARKWAWTFTYPNGHQSDTLHAPAGEPVRMVMTSEDVLHSFWIPAFRVKQDVVPGRYATLWFDAEPGEYVLECTEYCGTKHSDMLAKVVIQPRAEFDKWLDEQSSLLARMSPEEAGKQVFANKGCVACHSTDGTQIIGPTFKGLYNHEVPLADGTKVVADENYIRESILDPQAKLVAGFGPVMPTFQGTIKDEEITALIAYIKTLK